MSSASVVSAAALPEHEIGANSYGHAELSLIRKVRGQWIFPSHFYEDYFIDYLDSLDVDCTEVASSENKDAVFRSFRAVDANLVTLEELQRVRIEAYSALVWYEPLRQWTYKSELHRLIPPAPTLTSDWWKESVLQALQDSAIDFPCFVKLDTMSAKDTGHNGVFQSADQVVRVFESSDRIRSALEQPTRLTHFYRTLFVRAVDASLVGPVTPDDVVLLLRCFVHAGRLAAISCDCDDLSTDEAEVVRVRVALWFDDKEFRDAFPYRDATPEVRVHATRSRTEPRLSIKSIMLVEVNNFGADSVAGAGQFNWRDDYFILHGAGDLLACASGRPFANVVFRGPPKLE